MRPRLFLDIFSMEARRLMSYRVDFWVSTLLGVMVSLMVPYYLWSTIYSEMGTDVIGGYSFVQMFSYYVTVTLVSRAVRGPDVSQTLSTDIYEGGLNRYLIYPTRYVPFKYAQHLGACVPGFLQFVVLGSLLLFVWGATVDGGFSAGAISRGVVSVLLANALYFLMGYPIQGIAFWADNVWSLAVLMRFISGILGGFHLPLSLFPDGYQRLLEMLPFHHLYFFPVRVLNGEIGTEVWLQQSLLAVLWCALFALMGRWVWRRGGLSYTGVGI